MSLSSTSEADTYRLTRWRTDEGVTRYVLCDKLSAASYTSERFSVGEKRASRAHDFLSNGILIREVVASLLELGISRASFLGRTRIFREEIEILGANLNEVDSHIGRSVVFAQSELAI